MSTVYKQTPYNTLTKTPNTMTLELNLGLMSRGPAVLCFIERLSSLPRLKCTSIIEKGLQSVSFVGKGLSECPLSEVLLYMGRYIYTSCKL